jgi:hypothetical protein
VALSALFVAVPRSVWLPRGWELLVARRSAHLLQVKIPSGLLHIPGDLVAESLDGRELNFFTYMVEEMQLDFGLRGQLNGMKIQQVSFDRERI